MDAMRLLSAPYCSENLEISLPFPALSLVAAPLAPASSDNASYLGLAGDHSASLLSASVILRPSS